MFEKEIKFIIDFTLNRVNKLGSFFPFERLASAEIHPAILLYISAHLDHLIYEDRKKLLQNSSFDYSGGEISHYFNLISEEIKKNKRLAFEDVRTLVTHAVTFNINYLVRPNWTLGKLIFDEDKTKNVNEIKMMLNYLYYYDYVKNVFFGYFSKRKILSLNETEFSVILGKIDKQMFSKHTNDLIDNALVSIGDFFNEGGINKTRIQTQTVELFLKEKDLMEALFKLRRAIPADDKRKYDIEEIRKILYSKEPVKTPPADEEKAAEEEDEEVPQENEIADGGETKERHSADAETDETESYLNEMGSGEHVEDITLSEGDETDIEAAEEKVAEDEEVIQEEPSNLNPPEESKIEEESSQSKTGYVLDEINESLSEISEEENEKERPGGESPEDFLSRYKTELRSLEELEEQLDSMKTEDDLTFTELDEEEDAVELVEEKDESGSEDLIIEEEELSFDDDEVIEEKESVFPAPTRTNNDILSFLSDKDMEKIVSKVFNEDEEDFVNTMEKISESVNYDEATEILKAVFFSYKVSPYSREAVVLTNAVSNFFNQD